jgi:hypothetical protein
MQSAWDEIRRTVDAVPTPGHRPPWGGPRRKLRKLAKITSDDRWLTLAANVKLLSDPQEWCYGTKYTVPVKANPGGYRVANRIPTRGAWLDYLKAAEEVRWDLAVLAGGLDTSP